jgi:hypothetical protein
MFMLGTTRHEHIPHFSHRVLNNFEMDSSHEIKYKSSAGYKYTCLDHVFSSHVFMSINMSIRVFRSIRP